jgi:nicotinate-nucleotide adenylyltransferase
VGRRIGIFGGTFDPVHVGHLVAAVNVRSVLDLDVVLLVVANEPWQKVGERAVTAAADRLALVAAAASDCDGIEVSAIEIERGGPSYTADTVATLRAAEPDSTLYVIVGEDVVPTLATWSRLDEVRENTELVVVNRPGSPIVDEAALAPTLAGWPVTSVEVPALEISSTDLRDRAATHRPLDFLIPEAAVRVIAERGLYAVGR